MSIRLKLIIMFLVIALIPLLFVSALTYHNYRDSLETTRLAQLADLALSKAQRIDAYLKDVKAYMTLLQNAYALKKSFPLLSQFSTDSSHPEYRSARQILEKGISEDQPVLTSWI